MPVSRARIERFIALLVAAFGLVFGAVSVPAVLVTRPYLLEPWATVMAVAFLAGLVALAVAALAQRFVRVCAAYVALAFAVVLVLWPLLAVDSSVVVPYRPWPWFVCTVSTAAAALVLPVWSAAAYTVLAPAAIVCVRLLPVGGEAGGLAVLDGCYAAILGGVALTLIVTFRRASFSVDEAARTALERYAAVVRSEALEQERAAVDALVHDSVLTTLLTAAGARDEGTRERAALMAADALERLRSSTGTSRADAVDSPVDLIGRIRTAASTFSPRFSVSTAVHGDARVPSRVAEAVYAAAVQAIVNSMQHAGGADVSRAIEVEAGPGGFVRVSICDTGSGFDDLAVPADRLGVRVSIVERMASVGGEGTVTSVPGRGTRVDISWSEAWSGSGAEGRGGGA